jgi:uncharacterized Zn finger protein
MTWKRPKCCACGNEKFTIDILHGYDHPTLQLNCVECGYPNTMILFTYHTWEAYTG